MAAVALKQLQGQSLNINGKEVTVPTVMVTGEQESVSMTSVDCPQWLKNGVKDFSAGATKGEVISTLTKLAMRREAATSKTAELNYTGMPERIQEVMKIWDTDASGTVGVDELMSAAKAQQQLASETRQIKRMVQVMAVVIVILAGMNFLMAFVSAELSKDLKPTEDGVLAPTAGRVEARNGSMGTLSNGDHTVSPATRSLQERGEDDLAPVNAVATRQVRVEGEVTSTLSDEDLRELKTLTLNYGSGGSVEVNVISRLREDTVHSRCGSVVHLVTPYGRMTLDDTEIYIDDAMQHALGFGNTAPGTYGRRLAADTKIRGFYNNFTNVKWECNSVMKPQVAFRNYRMQAITDHPCTATKGCRSIFAQERYKDNGWTVGWKAGVRHAGTKANGDSIMKIAVQEETFVYNGETITKSKFPNHPLQQLVRAELNGKLITFQEIFGQTAYCDQQERVNVAPTMLNRILAGQELDASMFRMSFLGRAVDYTVDEAGTHIRKFRIEAATPEIAAEHKIVPVQYWDLDQPGDHRPYKYFVDDEQVNAVTSQTTIAHIEELTEEQWQQVRGAIPDDLGADKTQEDARCSLGGRNSLFMKDLPKIAHPGDEDPMQIKWYYDFFQSSLRAGKVDASKAVDGSLAPTKVTKQMISSQYGKYWADVYGSDDENVTRTPFIKFMETETEIDHKVDNNMQNKMSHRVSVGTGVVPMKVSEMSIGEYEAEDAKLKSMQMARYEEPNMNVISATTMNLGEESEFCEPGMKCFNGRSLFWGATQYQGCRRFERSYSSVNMPFEAYQCSWKGADQKAENMTQSRSIMWQAKSRCVDGNCTYRDATGDWKMTVAGHGGIQEAASKTACVSTGDNICRDTHPDCAQWESEGDCELPETIERMKQACPVTCMKKFHHSGAASWESEKWCQGTDRQPFTCMDKSPKCAFYHAAGFCDRHQTAMRQFMDTECQATCNYCKEDECVSTEIPSWSTGGNAQITLERSFSIMKNARNNIGANHVELKFQFAGKASMHGVAPDQDFRVSFVFPVTVKGTGFAQIMGMDMGDMELGSSLVATLKVFPFRRWEAARCASDNLEGKECRLFGQLFDADDWFTLNVEGSLWVPVQIDIMVVAFTGYMYNDWRVVDGGKTRRAIVAAFQQERYSTGQQVGSPYCKYNYVDAHNGAFECMGLNQSAMGRFFHA